MFEHAAEIRISITDLASGDGVGRCDGQVCFVAGALPGEEVRARVTQKHKSFLRAELIEILKSSPFREDPPCAYISECGGCQYQHVQYEEELRWKAHEVRETLTRIGGVSGDVLQPIVAGPKTYGYRTALTMHQGTDGAQQIWGFYTKDNESIIAIDRCLIASDAINEKLEEGLGAEKDGGAVSVTLREANEHMIFDSRQALFFKRRFLDRELWVHTRGFFQVNQPVAEAIVRCAESWVADLADFELYDIYCGMGLFGLFLGQRAKRIFAFESSKYNLEALRRNLDETEKGKFEIISGSADRLAPRRLPHADKQGAAVIVNPPRSGLGESLSRRLAKGQGIQKLIYVSCHPAAMARDVKIILEKNRFRLAAIQPFDMFPRTKHVEVLAHLVRV